METLGGGDGSGELPPSIGEVSEAVRVASARSWPLAQASTHVMTYPYCGWVVSFRAGYQAIKYQVLGEPNHDDAMGWPRGFGALGTVVLSHRGHGRRRPECQSHGSRTRRRTAVSRRKCNTRSR